MDPNYLKDTAQTVVSALVLTFFIYFFITTPNQVQGLSMYPNIKHNDLILTNRMRHLIGNTSWGKSYDYKRGDIVIFQQPGKEHYIKRVIALPGEKIKVENQQIFVNGQVLEEEYIGEDIITRSGSFLREGKEITVPDHQYFVMGDNRTNSKDSRDASVGFVDRQYLVGPAMIRLLPLSEFGILKAGEIHLKDPSEIEVPQGNQEIEISNTPQEQQ